MIQFRAACLAAGAAMAALADPSWAQSEEAGAERDSTIVVTGEAEKPARREVDRQAREITYSSGDELHSPLARMEDRLCPGVLGLKADAAALVVERIRWQGERLGMWMAPEDDCHPNLIVAFVDDGQAELTRLAESSYWLFETMTVDERKALLAEEGPVRVWTRTLMRTSNGLPIARRDRLDRPPVMQMEAAHSKIYVNIREDIDQVVVLFDRGKIGGKTLIQLADYAAMRGFARTRPTGADAPLDTILALFDPSAEPPQGLTDFDFAYLRNLYEGIPNLRARSKILGVNSELGQVLKEKAEQ